MRITRTTESAGQDDGGLAIAACMFCCGARPCGQQEAGSAALPRERLTVRRPAPQRRWERGDDGDAAAANQRWSLDFVSTSSPTLGASASWRWSTMLPGNAWRSSPTPRSPADAWRGTRRHHSTARKTPRHDRQRQRTELTSNASSAGRMRPASAALHRAWQAAAERLHRELQRPPARRAVERELFRSLPHARAALEAWRHDYNNERRTRSSAG